MHINLASEENFVPTSNPADECYLFRKVKQRHDETIHEVYKGRNVDLLTSIEKLNSR